MEIRKDETTLDSGFPFQICEFTLTKADDKKESFHWHSFFEITYILSGCAVYFVNERTYEVGAGDFVIFNHVEPHGWEIQGEQMKVIVMIFSSQLISERMGNFDYEYLEPLIERGSNYKNKIPKSNGAAKEMEALILEIYREWMAQAIGFRLMVKADVLKLLTLLIRHYTDETKPMETLSEKKNGMKRLESVLTYMYVHYAEKITLEEMAKESFMSTTYFSAYFKKMMGNTFSEYLAGIRIREVQRLLRNTSIGVIDAAMECGFHNISNFYRIYKKYTGKNPSEERGIK